MLGTSLAIILMELRVPWRVKRIAYLLYQHVISWISRIRPNKKNAINISFLCNYHAHTTGATVAIACIANSLSKKHNIDAFIKPHSGFSSQFNLMIKQYWSSDSLNGQIIFVDIEQENAVVEKLLHKGKTVILTCHAFPLQLHGVTQPDLIKNLKLCSHIHFVSEHQRSEFVRQYPDIDIETKSFVIPNFTRQNFKKNVTQNIGMIGHLGRVDKNALSGIQLAQQTNAQSVQCWGSYEVYGLDKPSSISKLQLNGWCNNLIKMHESFDILLSSSQFETFGLVVVEAMSAGIPCVLSDIPVYRELYSGCKGVIFLTGDIQKDIEAINQLLEHKDILKSDIINFWHKRFSNVTIESKWLEKITTLSSQ